MIGREYDFEQRIMMLREREKELRCLYNVEEMIRKDLDIHDFFIELIRRMPYGWQYPEICRAKVIFEGKMIKEEGWEETDWFQSARILVDQNFSGFIYVFYTRKKRFIKDSPFLPEEQKLLNSIASRAGNYIFNRRLKQSLEFLKQEMDDLSDKPGQELLSVVPDEHWEWRKRISNLIAEKLDMQKFGVSGIYLIGSSKTGQAGPASDIDLLVHISSPDIILDELRAWFEGWSLCLSDINYSRTGYKTDGLLDVHFITDLDIKNKTSYGIMIGNNKNSALPLRVY
ncbi:MAG: nucleotidyltransferase domain-containing protein [Bacteroidales bacterium]|nr:nucleotidyltransferase domain-containing protein [Bacteroidales bacterium]